MARGIIDRAFIERLADPGVGGHQEAVAVTEDLPPMTPEAEAMAAVPEWKRIMALIVIFLLIQAALGSVSPLTDSS